jgi:hypothetical protein
VQQISILGSEAISVKLYLFFFEYSLEVFDQFVDAGLKQLFEAVFDGMEAELNSVAVLLAHHISHFIHVFPLNVGNYQCLCFILV